MREPQVGDMIRETDKNAHYGSPGIYLGMDQDGYHYVWFPINVSVSVKHGEYPDNICSSSWSTEEFLSYWDLVQPIEECLG